MKKLRKVFAFALLIALLLSLNVVAFADDTTYLVRVYAGNKGTVSGGEVIEATVKAGEKFNFSLSSVAVTDDKYYARGIREAGLDNAMVYAGENVSITINEDVDFVVAYGMKSTAVTYTVNYRSNNGTTLAPSQTYYGNVGDKPVVAHIYVDGYQPQAYNLTKTLSENEAENVFTFTYTQAATTTVITPVVPGNGQQNNQNWNNQNWNNQNNPNTPAVQPGQNAQGANQGGAANNTQPQPQTENTTPAEPEEIIDLDVPLAAPDAEHDAQSAQTQAHKRTVGVYIAALLGIAAALAALALLMLRRNRKENEND